MTFTTIEIELANGRKYTFPSSDFDFFATTNELEHKREKIIVTLSALEKSFVYELDEDTGEIVNKKYLQKVTIK
jgi:hypothetical protein